MLTSHAVVTDAAITDALSSDSLPAVHENVRRLLDHVAQRGNGASGRILHLPDAVIMADDIQAITSGKADDEGVSFVWLRGRDSVIAVARPLPELLKLLVEG